MIRKDGQPEATANIQAGRWQDQSVRFRPNRIIVKFRTDLPQSEAAVSRMIDSVAQEIPGGILQRPPGPRGRAVFTVAEDTDIVRVAEALSNREDIEYAEPDIIDSAQIIPSDTRYAEQWAHGKVSSPTAWDLETGNASKILIGIIDSGISMSAVDVLDHSDLNQTGRYILGTDFVDGGTPRDLNSHGTHVAGIAAAETNNANGVSGMNWGSNVYICRTLDAFGNGSSADFADAVEEIVDYAIAHNLKVVINYSAGGGANQTKWDACQYINDNGMILCAATGNDSGPVIFPAAYSTIFDGVIAVGATDQSDNVADFSNTGPEVTVVAPGVSILSTTPTYSVSPAIALNYDFFDGTSMATPLVTGLCALMWSRHPSFTNKRIRDCLTNTAKKLGSGTFDNSWGFGRVEAEKALRCGDIWFTPFTRFTWFTHFTLFTRFSLLTRFTRFTLFTRFTQFTRFDPVPGPIERRTSQTKSVEPFLRFGSTIYDPAELALTHFVELEGAWEELYSVGFGRIDEIATTDPRNIVEVLGYSPADAGRLVKMCQDLMRDLAEGDEVPFEVVEGYIAEGYDDFGKQK